MGAHRNIANKREQDRRQLRRQRELDRRARADEKRERRLERRHGTGRPIGAVWLRQPTIADQDGEPIPNPDALLVSGGWYLPDAFVTAVVSKRQSRLDSVPADLSRS